MKLVSIIMPTYNREKMIGRSIKSVLNQTYKNVELIVIDDGSADNTVDVIASFHDERIRYYKHSVNRGACFARNYGIEHSTGEYIAFLDSDCVWEKTFLEDRIMAINDSNADLIFGRMQHIFGDEVTIWPCEEEKDLSNEQYVAQSLIFRNLIDTNTVMLNRNCWKQEGGFDQHFLRLQDWEYFSRIVHKEKYKICFRDNVLVKNYIQQDSISQKQKWGVWRTEILKQHVDYCRKKNILIDTIKALYFMPQDFEGNADYRKDICLMLNKDELFSFILYLEGELERKDQKVAELNNEIVQRVGMNTKDARIHEVLRKWLICRDHNKKIDKFFEKRKIHTVAIYGFGVLGRALYGCLNNTSVSISYIIDRNTDRLEKASAGRFLSDVEACNTSISADAIVVTAIMEYEEIKKTIQSNMIIPKVYSIEELINDLQNEDI